MNPVNRPAESCSIPMRYQRPVSATAVSNFPSSLTTMPESPPQFSLSLDSS